MTRARHVFTVSHGRMALIVRVMATVQEVDAEYRGGRRRREKNQAHAFFLPAPDSASHTGTIVLAINSELLELVPHEVAHASQHHLGGAVSNGCEERHAIAIGLLSARIFSQLRMRGVEV
ncbi:hypothetical protein DLREEDagrD3_28680 [Denitratisoma sp. agr-D3]